MNKHMINKKHQLGMVVVMLALLAIAAGTVWGQGRGPRFAANGQATATRDPLAFLKQALNKAGAGALTTDQETKLNALITSFRSANKPAPDPNEQTLRDNFDKAILAGDLTSANGYADQLATLLSTRQSTRLKAEAGFLSQAIQILTSDQFAALEKSIGQNGTLRVLQSLIGPGPGFGRGMMGARGQAQARRNPS